MARFAQTLVVIWLTTLGVIGCGGGDDPATPDAPPSVPDAAGMAVGFPSTMMIAASQATIPIPFTVTSNGTGSAPFGRVAMTSDVGTVELDGVPVPSFVYMTVPFGEYVLYQGFAVGPDRWDVFWLYCRDIDLAYIYDEGISGRPLFVRPATGRCNDAGAPATAPVSLPPLALPAPVPFGGYAVTGTDITVGKDGNGTLNLNGRRLPLVVFGDVDCSGCGGMGWYELHSILWDEMNRRVIFVIIYLISGQSASVQLTYARSLPDLGDPIGTRVLPSSWTVNPTVRSRSSSTARTDGPRFGVPPPGMQLQLP
jgi:hypothetical protein